MQDYVEMNYDKISKGFTPNFIKQLKCLVHPEHAWWNKEKLGSNSEARCSAFLELEGGVPDQFCYLSIQISYLQLFPINMAL